jgi:hypothetical protein
VAECVQVVTDLQTVPVFNTLSQNTISQDMEHSPREHEAQARPTTRTFPVFNPAGSDEGQTSRLGEQHVGALEESGPAEDVVSSQHIAWLMQAQSKNIIVLAKIGAQDDLHAWGEPTVKGRDEGEWIIEWEHRSPFDTLKSASETKRSAVSNSWQKETVQK